MAIRKLIRKNLTKKNVPNKSGVYTLYNKRGTAIYTGHSKQLRHRIQSYIQQDDLIEHRTKRQLRRKAEFFSFRRVPIERARELEKQKKKRCKYNFG